MPPPWILRMPWMHAADPATRQASSSARCSFLRETKLTTRRNPTKYRLIKKLISPYISWIAPTRIPWSEPILWKVRIIAACVLYPPVTIKQFASIVCHDLGDDPHRRQDQHVNLRVDQKPKQ